LEIEPGRILVIKTLPSEGQEMIAPAVAEDLEGAYFSEISKTASDQIKSDGELIYLWPDLLDVTINWRSDPQSGKDPRMQIIPAQKDGGTVTQKPSSELEKSESQSPQEAKSNIKPTYGGVDFRVFPSAVQPMVKAAAGRDRMDRVSVLALDKQWAQIQKTMAQGQMPYAQLKEYVSACTGRQDAYSQMEIAAACITRILKMEEERALPTALELKEILPYIG
jgi:hypothetical protein